MRFEDIPPPPCLPRPASPIRWTRGRCERCTKIRTMPEAEIICGECQDLMVRVKTVSSVDSPHSVDSFWLPTVREKRLTEEEGNRYLDRLRPLMKERGLGYKKLADLVRWTTGGTFSPGQAYRLAHMQHRATPYNIRRVAKALGVGVDELWTPEYNSH